IRANKHPLARQLARLGQVLHFEYRKLHRPSYHLPLEIMSTLVSSHHGRCGIQHTDRESTLVVIPGGDLDQASRSTGQQSVYYAGCCGVIMVCGNQRLVTVLEDAFELALGGITQDLIDLVNVSIALDRKITRLNSSHVSISYSV